MFQAYFARTSNCFLECRSSKNAREQTGACNMCDVVIKMAHATALTKYM